LLATYWRNALQLNDNANSARRKKKLGAKFLKKADSIVICFLQFEHNLISDYLIPYIIGGRNFKTNYPKV